MKKPTWVVFDVSGVIVDFGRFDEEMWNLVKDLKEAGYKLAIFTNAETSNHRVLQEKIGLEGSSVFEKIIKSSFTGFLKPNPQSYKNVESILGASGQDILFVDDSKGNTSVAKKLFNWQVYIFGNVEELRKILLT